MSLGAELVLPDEPFRLRASAGIYTPPALAMFAVIYLPAVRNVAKLTSTALAAS